MNKPDTHTEPSDASQNVEAILPEDGITSFLTSEEVLRGYDAVSALYAHVPPLSHWRAWEYAAYQKFQIDGHILDVGCGDGRYFRLVWPHATDVIGVDMSPEVAELGLQSGVYRKVHVTAAHEVPEPDQTFDNVFANCSLEHMDNLDQVLREINRCLKPGGVLLCSVVTDRFFKWSLLSNLVAAAGFDNAASKLKRDFFSYHNLVNPLAVEEWKNHFTRAGLTPEQHIPILPKFSSNIFLLMDSLWHVKDTNGDELGKTAYQLFSESPGFIKGFRSIVQGLLEMETNWSDCSGAVFLVRKPT